jgi:hypothetical protein
LGHHTDSLLLESRIVVDVLAAIFDGQQVSTCFKGEDIFWMPALTSVGSSFFLPCFSGVAILCNMQFCVLIVL